MILVALGAGGRPHAGVRPMLVAVGTSVRAGCQPFGVLDGQSVDEGGDRRLDTRRLLALPVCEAGRHAAEGRRAVSHRAPRATLVNSPLVPAAALATIYRIVAVHD